MQLQAWILTMALCSTVFRMSVHFDAALAYKIYLARYLSQV